MKLEFLEGEKALRNSGAALKEGEAFVFVDGKQVKQEVIDRFNNVGHYVGERPTGMTGELIVNLYKISVELIDRFNEHVLGIKFTDLDDKESFIEIALIPSKLHHWDGTIKEDFYVSERINDSMHTRPSKIYKEKLNAENRKWGQDTINEEQSN